MRSSLEHAIQLRHDGRPQEALQELHQLLQHRPDDPDVNYQTAWTYDSMGEESKAVPHYEAALANGLVHDREGAMLGLGSTYRCLGQYQKSRALLDRAVEEFPQNRALRVFRAMTLHNLGEHEGAVQELLLLLLETSSDGSIRSYEKALRFYSDKLSQTWD